MLILDEPTSSLDAGEVAQLFRVMRQLRDEGIAILFVTHFLDQVYEIADRITVLRNGRLVGEYLHRGAAAARAGREDDRQGAGRPGAPRGAARAAPRSRRWSAATPLVDAVGAGPARARSRRSP